MIDSLRSSLFFIGYVLLTLIWGFLLAVIVIFPSATQHRIVVAWCWLVVQWARFTCGIRFEIIGKDNIAKTNGNYMVLSKHQSTWETFIFQVLFCPLATILKKELLKIPIFGWGLSRLKPIAIDRSNPREALRQVKEQGIHRLQNGMNCLVFPEGTRMAPGEKGKYARSGADIAIAAGVEVLPVAVNAGRCWPPKQFAKHPGKVTVVIGEPIPTLGKTSREVTEQTEAWIEEQMSALEAGSH